MKRLTANLMLILSVALFSTVALAEDDGGRYRYEQHAGKHHAHYDYARVIRVEPIVRLDRVPAWQRRCWHGYTDHCRAIRDYHASRHIEGYRVTYRYQGHNYVTRMNRHPGRRIKVKVNVIPVYH